jgi:hypothetical protein
VEGERWLFLLTPYRYGGIMPEEHSSFAERLNETPPTTVKLADGDVFVGRWDHLERGESAYGPCFIAVFTEPDVSGLLAELEIPEGGKAAVWLFHEALLKRLQRLRPTKGERLAIKRLGKRLGGNDRNYVDYSVVSERQQAGEIGWDEVEPPTGVFAERAAAAVDNFDDNPPF